MSTLQCTNLQDTSGGNSRTTAQIYSGTAKAWVNFDGTTASPSTIRASFNVSSITKNGTGDYTVNFSSAFSDANYSVSAQVTDTPTYNFVSNVNGSSVTTTSVKVISFRVSDRSLADTSIYCVSVFR